MAPNPESIVSISTSKRPIAGALGIEIGELSFDSHPLNQTVVLRCLHRVSPGEQLDTFRLRLNGSEFYSYAPYASANYQKQAQFWVDGVSVDVSAPTGNPTAHCPLRGASLHLQFGIYRLLNRQGWL